MIEKEIDEELLEDNQNVEIQEKRLRPHKKIDYYEDFSEGDQEEYAEAQEKRLVFRHINAKRARKKNEDSAIDQNKEATQPVGYGNIIDITSLSRSHITNSEIILLLLEICLNSSKYGLTSDSSSRNFWEELSQRDDLFCCLQQFKPETLRKYWRKLRTTFKYKKMISVVKENQSKLDDENMKLLSSINVVSEYVINPSKGIDYYIQKYKLKQPIQRKNNEDDEEIFDEEETYNEKAIRETIDTFSKIFPDVDRDEIVKKLMEVSGDPEKAYLYIKDNQDFSYLAFNKEEDDIIKEMNRKNEDNREFRWFILKKGNENIKKRREFLFN